MERNTNRVGFPLKRLRESCGIRSRTVQHFPAGSRNGRPIKININNPLEPATRSTNQGVVGSNPAGRANTINGLG